MLTGESDVSIPTIHVCIVGYGGDDKMQTKNTVSVGRFPESNKPYSFETSTYLNLPDLQFFHWCNHHFRINRGVYNAIDQWFYDYGIINIQYRRIQTLAFFEFVKEEGGNQSRD